VAVDTVNLSSRAIKCSVDIVRAILGSRSFTLHHSVITPSDFDFRIIKRVTTCYTIPPYYHRKTTTTDLDTTTLSTQNQQAKKKEKVFVGNKKKI